MTEDESAIDQKQTAIDTKLAASAEKQAANNNQQAASEIKNNAPAGHTRPHLDSLEDKPVADYSCLISSGKRKRRFDPNFWKLSNTGLLAILKTEAFLQKSKRLDKEQEENQ
jgi:hypothetical protein